MMSFFQTIADHIHLVAIVPDGPTQGRNFGSDAQAAQEWASDQNAQGKNIYWTVNCARPNLHKKPSKKDIIDVRYAHIDIDPPKDGSSFDKEAVISKLSSAPIQPSFTIWSGNGVQAFWRVNGISHEQGETINRGLISYFGGDVGTHNIDRLMRVPGFTNYPNKKKRDQGRVAVEAYFIQEDDGSESSYDELALAYPYVARPAVERGNISPTDEVKLLTSADVPATLAHLIDQPKGEDRSADTLKFACEALRTGLTPEQVLGILLNQDNAIAAHCVGQRNAMRAACRAVDKALKEPDVAAYLAPLVIDGFPTAKKWTLAQMEQDLIFVANGSQVADINNPRGVLPISDFKNLTAASQMIVNVPAKGGGTRAMRVLTFSLWLNSVKRKEVRTLTFNPADEALTVNPHGESALNTWRDFSFDTPPDDWRERAQPFVRHVEWLWVEEAGVFLDWQAHIVQKPGELPAFGFLHIAPTQGMGRNWVASVLARVLGNVTALGVDLASILNGGFNGTLAGKILAVVDEIDEGGPGGNYQRAQKLKSLITEEVRTINPKFGRITHEFNVCRWLIFSNSLTALPLEGDDRRFYVSRCDDRPRAAEYYTELYKLRDDPQFIASVAHYLRQRDISAFKPGAIPPINAAKRSLLDRTRSEAEEVLQERLPSWPSDLIDSEMLRNILGDDMPSGRAMRHICDRVGMTKIGRLKKQTPFGEREVKVYAIRNATEWMNAPTDAWRKELAKRPPTAAAGG
jgi:hypothetical protein